MQIKDDDLSGAEIAELLTEHLRSVAEVSPPESRHALNLTELRRPDIKFWSVWIEKQLVGCGALKHLDAGHGEIKSMRTTKAHLRKGVASFILQEIVAEPNGAGIAG